jgi:Protein of unknown function (DUF4054)
MPAYDDAKFRAQFPAFADTVAWPEPFLQSCWNMAAEFISTAECPCRNLSGDSLQLALDLMCAHIATLLGSPAATGDEEGSSAGGLITNASIGAVSVGIMAPPVKNMWDYWLGQTPYGQQLLALFAIKAVGGFYVGGLPERKGFRKVGGTFW